MLRLARRVATWTRVPLVPWWALIFYLVVFVYFFTQALYRSLPLNLVRWLGRETKTSDFDSILLFYTVMPLIGLSAFLGFLRAIRFHPLSQPNYRKWLSMGPWTSAKPLPFGPITLVPADLFWIAFATLLGYFAADYCLLAIPCACIMGYQYVLMLLFFETGAKNWGIALAYGLLASAYIGFSSTWAMFVAVLLLNFVVRQGVWCSLQRFPWYNLSPHDRLISWEDVILIPSEPFGEPKSESLAVKQQGWPHSLMGPKLQTMRMSLRDRIFCASVMAIIAFLFCRGFKILGMRFELENDRFVSWSADSPVYNLLTFLILLNLVTQVVSAYRSPVNVVGRACTFRWIIPAYDIRYLPLFSSLVCIGLCLWSRENWPRYSEWIAALAAFGVAFCLFVVGKSRRDFQLTAPVRIAPVIIFGENRVAEL